MYDETCLTSWPTRSAASINDCAIDADLMRRYKALGQQPFDLAEHAAHIKHLHAHLEALRLYLAPLPQGRL